MKNHTLHLQNLSTREALLEETERVGHDWQGGGYNSIAPPGR
jgi:hypothetical protein